MIQFRIDRRPTAALAFALACGLALGLYPADALGGEVPRLFSDSLPRGGPSGGATLSAPALVTQAADATENGLTSQSFTDQPAFSIAISDDFVVPNGRAWEIRSFHAEGAYDSGIIVPDSYTFAIYPDASGEPTCGAPVYTVTVNPGAPGLADVLGVFDYCPGPLLTTLGAGRYWVSVTVTMDFATRGQWFWRSHAVPHVNGFAGVADNPGGGFGLPPCAPPPGFDYDFAFSLGGEEIVPDEKACRAGNVNQGAGPIADVLTVGGSTGDPVCREVEVTAGVPVTIAIALPPAGGSGHYTLWIKDGEPTPATVTPIRYKTQSGIITDLGTGCLCLPPNNSVVPDSCPCSITFPTGRTSRNFGPATAAAFCVNGQPGFPRAPTSFQQTFPAGTFTVAGIILDPGSASSKPVSIMNWIVVRSN